MDLLKTDNFLLVLITLLTAFLLLTAGAYFQQLITRAKKRSLLQTHRSNGVLGEAKAKQYLLKHGFTILKEQAYSEHQLIIDGTPHKFQLRTDFIVSKNGVISVVDAKSGEEGSEPTNSSTRRQLFEYFIYCKADTAYIYNSKEDTLHEVTFVIDTTSRRAFPIGYIVLLVIVVELIGIMLLRLMHLNIPYVK